MHKLGLTNKVSAVLDPAEGYPKIIVNDRIIQGEVVETLCAQDISLIDANNLFTSSQTFIHSIHPNTIKLIDANAKADALYKELSSKLLEEGDASDETLEKLKEDPRIIDLFSGLKWMDLLIGYIPYYMQSEFPNTDVRWNQEIKLWQVVAIKEILPGSLLSLQQKSES